MKAHLSDQILSECKKKLLMLKQDVLNRARSSAQQYSVSLSSKGAGGDEIDQSVHQLEEHSFLVSQDRMRQQLLEIELALARMERGVFGICEETDEPIEIERLLAIPWTRLSIEGAELREAMSQRFAK